MADYISVATLLSLITLCALQVDFNVVISYVDFNKLFPILSTTVAVISIIYSNLETRAQYRRNSSMSQSLKSMASKLNDLEKFNQIKNTTITNLCKQIQGLEQRLATVEVDLSKRKEVPDS